MTENQTTINFDTFKNQFFYKTSEGSDGLNDYDLNYWNDPNLIIAQQALPGFTDFYLAYPKNSSGFEMEAGSVFNLVGGTPKALRNTSLTDNDPSNVMHTAMLVLCVLLEL